MRRTDACPRPNARGTYFRASLDGTGGTAVLGLAALCSLGGAARSVGLVPGPASPWIAVTGLGLVIAGIFAAIELEYQRNLARCRTVSRERFHLSTIILVPENPRLATILHRRRGFRVPRVPRLAYSIHVDVTWPRPEGISPADAAKLWSALYRADYDQILTGMRGMDVLLGSSTFNRHESPETRRALREGWRQDAPGPLLPAQPATQAPWQRATTQCRMFGAVVSRRRVDAPQQWRTRMFLCLLAPRTPSV